ncbi:jg26235, partial [Pararge aegeria aegeria]
KSSDCDKIVLQCLSGLALTGSFTRETKQTLSCYYLKVKKCHILMTQ